MDPITDLSSPPRRRGPAAWLGEALALVGVVMPAAATLACLVLAGFALVQWFTVPEAGWGHLGWFAFGLMASAAPWTTPKRGNAWGMLCATAMGAGSLWFAWQRHASSGPLACRPGDTLCRIAEGVRLSAGETAVMLLFGLAGLGLVLGGLRYALAERRRD